jgi:hypothetical protein
MQNLVTTLLIAFVLQTAAATSDHDQPQAAQPQTKPVPCSTISAAPNPSGNNPAIKVPNKWRNALNNKLHNLESQTGIPISDVTADIAQAANSKAAPCTPQGSPKTAQASPILHLPAGVVTTWLCNPIVTSTDPSHTVTFVTPDELMTAEPAQAGTFEADGAKANPKATVSCANLRRDPKNNRVFLAQ